MSINFPSKIYLFILTGFMLFGTLSAYLLTSLWQLVDVDYFLSIKIYLISVIIVFLINIENNKYRCTGQYLKLNSFKLHQVFAIFSYGLLFVSVITNINMPLLYVANLYSVIFPSLAKMNGKHLTSILFLTILIMLHFITSNRVFLASGIILYIWAWSNFGKVHYWRTFSVFLVLMLSVSFMKSDAIVDYSTLELIGQDITSKIGAEWRDGIIMHDRLSDSQINMGKLSYLQSILTIVPMHSTIGLINYQDYYINLPSTSLVINTGLNSQGYTGIRVGLIWESYMLFGWTGVFIYSVICASLLRISNNLFIRGDGFVIGSIIFLACIYSIVGMINFIFGIYFASLIIISILFVIFKNLGQVFPRT